MNKKDPAFLFYSKDWLAKTAEYMPEEKGVYIDLLCHQHQRGDLPSDLTRLARMVGLNKEEFLPIWETIRDNFEQTDNRLVNQKLNRVMKERSEKGKMNTITGTFAGMLRLGGYSSAQYKHLRSNFKAVEFMQYDKEHITDRLTDWLQECLKSIGDGNGNGNSNLFNGDKKEKNIFKIIPPTIEMVQIRIKEREIKSFTAEQFHAHYESKGWMIGKNKMKDWNAALTTWNNNKHDNYAITKQSDQRSVKRINDYWKDQ